MIYIHVPFCHRKCTYCAFYSKPVGAQFFGSHRGAASSANLAPLADYVDALISEMRERRGEQAHPIKTVYFGGGTPSILPLSELGRIVRALHDNFDLSQVEEVTLEANPEDLTEDYLHGLKALGFVNRLSIGIQSLDDETLRLIGRRHTAQQAVEAVENAYRAGFHNISVDFIYGIREKLDFLDSLDFLDGLDFLERVSHVSAYALTVEAGTALAVQVEQGRVALPDDDEVVRQYHSLHQQLTAAGFRQYEVSNYARPGFESRHNSRYWDRTPYLGLGPGAHSFDGARRRWNKRDGSFEEETLTEADAFNELLMTSLRTIRGLSLALVPDAYKKRLHRLMQPYVDCGWIVSSGECYCPTSEGLLHADGIAADLFDT